MCRLPYFIIIIIMIIFYYLILYYFTLCYIHILLYHKFTRQ